MRSALIPALAMALIGMANAQSTPEKSLKNPSPNTMTCSDLHQAAKTNDVSKIHAALKAGIAVDCRNGQKQTPLLTATLAGSTEAAKALIEAGADVNAQAENLDSPLLYAGAAGRLEILKLCLAAKPDFTVTNRYGGTALIPACERGHVEVVRELLKTKIPVNHVNNLGWTALLEAVLLSDGGPKHQEIVTLLLAHGADPKIADKEGATPLQHAERRGFTEMIKLLKNRGK